MNLIVENQVFPPVDFFKIAIQHSYITLEICETFQKMSFRNRYVIAGANGIAQLSIPVAGGREQKAFITEIMIDDSTDWRTKHWRSILSAYNKSPFFTYYSRQVMDLLFSQEKNLFSFNKAILAWVCKVLKINSHIGFTDQYLATYDEGLDFRNKILPKNFQDVGENWSPRYSQVFEDRLGFQANLSILDLLFCEGPNAGNLLFESVKKFT